MYYSLHNHTEASNARLIDSITKIEDLIQYAFDIGLKGVAITDHETVKAHVRASKYIKKQREKDKRWENFKLIYGNEIDYTDPTAIASAIFAMKGTGYRVRQDYEEFIANPAVFEKFNDIFEIEEMLLNVGNRYIHQ